MTKKLSLLLVVATSVFLTSCQNNPGPDLKNQTSSPPSTASGNISQIKASFLIFTNGTKRDFSAGRYHNLNTDVFIDPASPTTVVVNRTGITWGDFFNTLPMKLTNECLTAGTGQEFCTNQTSSLSFYINGQKEDSALTKIINNEDKLLVTYERNNTSNLEEQLNQVPEAD